MNGIPKLLHRWVVVISAPSCVPRVCFRSRPLSLAIFEFLLTHFTPCHARNARRTTGAWPAGFRARVPARIPCCLLCWSITRQRRPTCGDGPQAERRRKTLPPAFPLRLMLAGCGLSLTTTRTRMKTWALASSIKYRLDQWRFQEQEVGGGVGGGTIEDMRAQSKRAGNGSNPTSMPRIYAFVAFQAIMSSTDSHRSASSAWRSAEAPRKTSLKNMYVAPTSTHRRCVKISSAVNTSSNTYCVCVCVGGCVCVCVRVRR